MGNVVVFQITRLILVLTLLGGGYYISRKPRNFKYYAVIIASVYSLIEGLRWGRGVDYGHYYNDIVSDLSSNYLFITKQPELLYKFWIHTFNFIGLPFWVAFIVYSVLLITPVLLICKLFPKSSVWILGLFYVFTISQSENLIRQYIASSFLIFSYYYYLKNNTQMMLLSLIVAPFFHFSEFIVVFSFLLFVYTKRFLSKSWHLLFLVALYLFCFFLWSSSFYLDVAVWLKSNFSFLDIGYLNSADEWFTEEHSFDNSEVVNQLNLLHRFVFFLAIIVICFDVQKKYSKLRPCYYLSYLAIIFKTMGGNIELYNRFHNLFLIFLPFLVGISILILRKRRTMYQYYILLSLSLIYILYGAFYREMFSSSYAFVWDK